MGDSMKNLLIGTALLVVLGANPAAATLQITIEDVTTGASFSCADGQAGCDLGGGANNLLTLNDTVGNFFVSGTLSTSTTGTVNNLQMSSFSIVNNGSTTDTIRIVVSDTNFVGPVNSINESGSLTFNENIPAPQSSLSFYADPNNAQGAPGTPGTLLFTAFGTPLTDPDSFDGTHQSPFVTSSLYSMTEVANLSLRAGGSVTGLNESMLSQAIPEPKTWGMLLMGFMGMGALAFRRSRKDRLASI